MSFLAPLFACIALLYAMVGFGGGSSYTALLILTSSGVGSGAGLALDNVPLISLVCNIVVVAVGSLRFAWLGKVPWRRALPLICIAAPLAFLGGLTPIDAGLLVIIFGLALSIAALAMFFDADTPSDSQDSNDIPASQATAPCRAPQRIPNGLLYSIAGGLGYLAGIVGIGGGIFLAPILYLAHWARAHHIAATASLFILINSSFGLVGQLIKVPQADVVSLWTSYWSLPLAVLVGGLIGNHLSIAWLPPRAIRRLTALLVGLVAARLLWISLGG